MPKLPADLPENWTQGQTISPNGTEVGLTEQHGYNYLMKQVNNTQTEVNGINDALPDVAQEATVAEINNKIGTESDADTQPTLFGRLAQLKNVLLEKLGELLEKVTGIDGKIGTSGDTAGTATLFGQVKDISEKMPTGIVKSIQRGLERCDTQTEVTISPVNMEKSIIIVNSDFSRINASGVGGGMAARAGFTSSNKIYIVAKIESGYTFNQLQINWQVVEFY